MKIILASQSPRRKELLKLVVSDFEVIISNTDEKIIEKLEPEEKVTEIAYKKAKEVYKKTNRGYDNNRCRYNGIKRK